MIAGIQTFGDLINYQLAAGKTTWLPLEVSIAHPQEGDPEPPALEK